MARAPVKRQRRLPDDAVEALRDVVIKSMAYARDYVSEDQERLGDIYSGRDKGGMLFFKPPPTQGVPVDTWVHELKSGVVHRGATTAQLLTSRLRQIFVSNTPGRPQFAIEPRTPGAQKATETQELITDVALSGSGLEEAVQRTAWLAPVQNYVGLRLCYNLRNRDDTDRIKWEVIEAKECGYEPFSRRFKWHSRVCQWGSLDAPLRKAIMAASEDATIEPLAWEPVAICEVFDDSFALETGEEKRSNCRAHVFVNLKGDFYKDKRQKRPDLGTYVVTHDLRSNPLLISSLMEPAANEDIAPAEAVNWLGLLDAISDCAEQIRREVNSTNNINVYDADNVAAEVLKKAMQQPAGTQIWIPVNGVGQSPQGISHRMRPIERNSILGELITSLQTYLALLDDVTGVGPQDRGISVNPSKSATEAATLSASSSRTTAARLRKLMQLWEDAVLLMFEYQLEYFGEYLEVPTEGVVRKYRVPDPATCRYSFKVGLDEMQNLSRRGRLDTALMGHQMLVNHAVAFPNGESMLVAESLRRTLRALGWVDADAYTTERRQLGSPEDRYTKMLETGRDYIVGEQDDPMPHIAFLGAKLEEAVATGNDNIPVDRLMPAIQRFQILLRQREAQAASQGGGRTGVVPGVNAQGQLDNQIQQQAELGLPPEMSQQTLR